MVFLARRLGMLFSNWLQGAEDLERKIHTRMKHIHDRFLKQFSTNNRLKKEWGDYPLFHDPDGLTPLLFTPTG